MFAKRSLQGKSQRTWQPSRKTRCALAIAVSAAGALARPAVAGTVTWSSDGGSWSVAGDWPLSTPPTTNDNVILNPPPPAPAPNYPLGRCRGDWAAAVTLSSLVVNVSDISDALTGGTTPAFGFEQSSANQLTITGADTVGNTAPGVEVQDDGTSFKAAQLIVGGGATGTYITYGDARLVSPNLQIGLNAGGELDVQQEAHVFAHTLTVGAGGPAANLGLLNVSGGNALVVAYTLDIGSTGTGIVTQVAGDVYANSSAGIAGSGVVSVGTGGTGNTGLYQLDGGRLRSTTLTIGDAVTGAFAQTGGTNNVSGSLVVGNNASGTYSLSGSGSLLTSPSETINAVGGSSFTQSDGMNQAAGPLVVNGTYTLQGGTVQAQSETIGSLGNGVFNQSGGENSVTGAGTVLQVGAGLTGTYTLSGGRLDVATNMSVGSSVAGSVNQTGGVAQIQGELHINTLGSYRVTNGDLFLGDLENDDGSMHVGGGGRLYWLNSLINGIGGVTASFSPTRSPSATMLRKPSRTGAELFRRGPSRWGRAAPMTWSRGPRWLRSRARSTAP